MRLIGKTTPGRFFVCYLHFIGLDNINLGLSFNWQLPNVEFHLPFCFIRIGWQCVYAAEQPYRTFGLTPKKSYERFISRL